MTNRLWIRSLRSALTGHLTAFLMMALLSLTALSLENPSSAVLPIAFVSLGAGAVVCAIGVRKSEGGFCGALLGGGMFILLPLAASCFGSGSFFTVGTRFLVMMAALAIVLTVVLLFPKAKRKKRRRRNAPMRRK